MHSCIVFILAGMLSIGTAKDIKNSIISVVFHKTDANEGLMKLQSAKREELPVRLRDIVQNSTYGEHMCCRNRPVTLVTKSRQAKRITLEKTEVKTGSHDCALFGSCDTFGYIYREVITYVTEYFKDINYQQCPERHVVCCNYYIMVAERCVHFDDLHSVVQELLG